MSSFDNKLSTLAGLTPEQKKLVEQAMQEPSVFDTPADTLREGPSPTWRPMDPRVAAVWGPLLQVLAGGMEGMTPQNVGFGMAQMGQNVSGLMHPGLSQASSPFGPPESKIAPEHLTPGKGNRFYDADLPTLRELSTTGKGPELSSDMFVEKNLDNVRGIAIVHNSKDILPQVGLNPFEGEEANRLNPDKIKGIVLMKSKLINSNQAIGEKFATPEERENLNRVITKYHKALEKGSPDREMLLQEAKKRAAALNEKYFDQFADAATKAMAKHGIPVEVRP